MGTVFCFIQLQLDARIAGYPSFLKDPHLNLAKTLIAFFGLINTSIILIQIHCIYEGSRRQKFVHADSTQGSIKSEIVDEGVIFEKWDSSLNLKDTINEPML